jgi:hypothetical protein
VQVAVAVVGGVEGGGEHREEEIARSPVFTREVDLGDEAFEDAPLGGEGVLVRFSLWRFLCFLWRLWAEAWVSLGSLLTYVPNERQVLEIEQREGEGYEA